MIDMISCMIVAGGKSERFGMDKKFIKFKGKTFVENVVEEAREFSDEIVVSLGKGEKIQGINEKEGLKIAFDKETWKGPLVGICSSVDLCQGEYVVVLSVDSPSIKPDIFKEMIRECRRYDAVIPIRKDGKLEVLHAVYNLQKLKEACLKAQEKGERSVKDMTTHLENVKLIDIERFRKYDPNLLTFINVNTKEELDRLVKLDKEG